MIIIIEVIILTHSHSFYLYISIRYRECLFYYTLLNNFSRFILNFITLNVQKYSMVQT